MEGNYIFTLRTDQATLNETTIGRFDAFFPETDSNGKTVDKEKIPEFVKIENKIFKVKNNGGNSSIFVYPGILGEAAKPRQIEYSSATKRQFFRYRLREDKSQRIAFLGLILALIGSVIDLVLGIGKVHVYWRTSNETIIIFLIIGMILKIWGLCLIFKKGFWEFK